MGSVGFLCDEREWLWILRTSAGNSSVFGDPRLPRSRELSIIGMYVGYRKVPGVAGASDVETYCAVRICIDSWRWEGVPWYLRAGKCLATTATEVLVELKQPPQKLFADTPQSVSRANYLRFRLEPRPAIAVAARLKRAGDEFVGEQREFLLMAEQFANEAPYDRLLGDAMKGDATLSSPVRPPSRRPGRSSILSSRSTLVRSHTSRGAGGRRRPRFS